MHLEILVEELSAEAALCNLLPKILGDYHSFTVHPFNGKSDLLAQLPARLRGYRYWLPSEWRIVVLVDKDEQKCKDLKATLEEKAKRAGWVTKTAAKGACKFQLLNRLAIEELEAWFFGDVQALVAAYPRVSRTLGNKAPYRNPDAIAGGTWEALERVLQRAGYYSAGLPKIEAAWNISALMDPPRNKSKSFQVFAEGLRSLVS